MTQAERRLCLIRSLLKENAAYRDLRVPADAGGQRQLLRSLMNVRAPMAINEEFLAVQDGYLRQELAEAGVTDADGLRPVSVGLYLWQGDITRLRCGAIVNAANSGMTGCYIPCHACIDNCIHTYAGVQLRLDCAQLMAEQGREEPTGQVKITRAYNLPCDYVIHTVGPIVEGRVTREDRRLLASCYHRMRRGRCTTSCWRCWRTRTISSSPPMWITASRRRALIKSGCFIHRGTTACSSAAGPAAGRPLTMRLSYGRWRHGRRTCAFPQSFSPAVLIAADP